MTNSSIFTKVLALVLCLVMVLGTFTACFGSNDVDGEIDTEIKDVVDNETNNGAGDVEGGNENVDNGNTEEKDPNEIFSASAELGQDSLIYGALANGVLIGDHESYSAIIPADVKVEAGAQSLALSIKNVEEADESFADYNVAQSLDVHVAGIAADNTVPMIVNLGAVLEAGLGETELKLYHMENGTAVLMTRVDSVNDFAIHNQYYYNAETGEVSIYVASFSVFVAVETEASVWEDDTEADTSWYVGHENDTEFTLDNVAEFLGFRDLVDAGNTFEGKTVTLTVDINLNGKLFDPIGFGYYKDEKNTDEGDTNTVFLGTFDGGNHTIYGLYQQGWDLEAETGEDYTYSTAGAGLFASIRNATIKNLAVSGASIVMECVDMGIVVGYAQGECHFDNIIVTNSTIANYNRATGAVVGEVCYGPYGTEVANGISHTFKNITVDSSVIVSSLWGSFDTSCGGVVGAKWGDATVQMSNVTTAAELDVYSDVTAAYQWYAYRRCGMLIGHTEQNSPKKALNAAAEFLKCENVNVYYGDWVNYNYYEFNDQDSATGRNYPWVRAEASPVGNNGAFSNPRYGVPTYTVMIDGVSTTVTINDSNKEDYRTGYAAITFNQLYGGGQGVYGCNEHGGVTTHSKLTKTIYINNNLGWTNLKLYYWYANGEDRWATLIDGVDMSTMLVNGVYKLEIPAYADGFKITGIKNSVPVSISEVLLSAVNEDSTYSLNAFQLTLNIGETKFDVTPGNWLYNTQVNTTNVPTASNYDVVIYDKDYTGTFTTNGYGVAIVLDADGKLIKIYDGANGGYYTESGKAASAHFTTSNYATVAWSELLDDQTLIIFPNDGAGNYARDWVLSLRTGVGSHPSVGQKMTITSSVHVCENICDTCGKCTDWNCYNCNDYRCKCLVITIGDNKFTATEGKWLHNTAITSSTAQNYQMIVFDKNYVGTFTTNSFGVALVINNEGQLVKAYDAANGDGTVYYYDANSNQVATDVGGNANYATAAFATLNDGEMLIVFPNDGDKNVARNWAKNLCANIGDNATLTTPAGLNKTIYFQNNWLWTDVKVYYWYEEAWYNISWPGVSPTKVSNDGVYDIYKIDCPANATGLIISGIKNDGSGTRTQSVDVDTITNGYIYWCSFENNSKVELSANKYENGYATHDIYLKGDFNNWAVEDAYRLTPSGNGQAWTGTFTFDETVKVKMFNTLIVSGNGWINGEGYSDNVELAPGKYNFTYSTTNNTFTFNMTERKIFLNANVWNVDDAWFQAWTWGGSKADAWITFTDSDGDGIYEAFVPYDRTGMKIYRKASTHTNQDHNQYWNCIDGISIPTDGKNLYTVNGWDYGSWSRK